MVAKLMKKALQFLTSLILAKKQMVAKPIYTPSPSFASLILAKKQMVAKRCIYKECR